MSSLLELTGSKSTGSSISFSYDWNNLISIITTPNLISQIKYHSLSSFIISCNNCSYTSQYGQYYVRGKLKELYIKIKSEEEIEPGNIIDLSKNVSIEDYYLSFENEWNNFQKSIGKSNLLYIALGCDSSKQYINLFYDYNYTSDYIKQWIEIELNKIFLQSIILLKQIDNTSSNYQNGKVQLHVPVRKFEIQSLPFSASKNDLVKVAIPSNSSPYNFNPPNQPFSSIYAVKNDLILAPKLQPEIPNRAPVISSPSQAIPNSSISSNNASLKRKSSDPIEVKLPLKEIKSKILYCDGAMNPSTGKFAYASVVDAESNDIITDFKNLFSDFELSYQQLPKCARNIILCKFDDVAQQQNNGAELVSMVAALRVANISTINQIYSDSNLIIDFWSKGHVNKKTMSKMDSKKRLLIDECSKLRLEFEKRGGKILKVSGKDNLADLGYHRE